MNRSVAAWIFKLVYRVPGCATPSGLGGSLGACPGVAPLYPPQPRAKFWNPCGVLASAKGFGGKCSYESQEPGCATPSGLGDSLGACPGVAPFCPPQPRAKFWNPCG